MICSVEFVFETCENRRHKSTVCFNLTDRKANKYNISYKKFTYFISQHKNYQTNIYNDLPYKKKTILFHTETTWEKTIVIINELLRQFRYNLLAHNYEVWWWEDVVCKKCKLDYTSFLASKKLLRCLICQTPMTSRIQSCASDHQNTRWFVLSLVIRKRSSRYCNKRTIQIMFIDKLWF